MNMRLRQEEAANSHPSFTEWMERVEFPNLDSLKKEDCLKRKRLEILSREMSLQFERSKKIDAKDVWENPTLLWNMFRNRPNTNFSLRLIPALYTLPKLRTENQNLTKNTSWLFKQRINPEEYTLEIIPHAKILYSSIFLINEKGSYGCLIKDGHWQLTRGLPEHEPIYFAYDFKKWRFYPSSKNNQRRIKKIVKKLKINSAMQKRRLTRDVGARFNCHGYLKGYFECAVLAKNKVLFVDYNRIIANLLKNFNISINNKVSNLKGVCASPGNATGKIHIINDPLRQKNQFKKGEILVCEALTIDYLPMIKKAGAIISQRGNILSHPAIICHEIKMPYITNVKNAISALKDGDKVKINAKMETIRIVG